MARTRKFSNSRKLHAMNELNVTPLLDLCFCLLIIFMIATPVMEQTARVNLPKAASKSGSAPPAKKTKYVFVSFDPSGVIKYEGKLASLDEVRSRFKEIAMIDHESQPVVRIRGDRSAAYDTFAKILEAFTGAKLTKLGVDYEQ